MVRSGRGLIEGTVTAFAWKDEGKPRDASVRVASIRTKTSLLRSRSVNHSATAFDGDCASWSVEQLCLIWLLSNFRTIWKVVVHLRRSRLMIRLTLKCPTPQSDFVLGNAPELQDATRTASCYYHVGSCSVPSRFNPIHIISMAVHIDQLPYHVRSVSWGWKAGIRFSRSARLLSATRSASDSCLDTGGSLPGWKLTTHSHFDRGHEYVESFLHASAKA
jgi:hypothetical protein